MRAKATLFAAFSLSESFIRLVRISRWVLLIELAAFSLSTVPGIRQRSGFDPLIDGWLQGGGYVTAAWLCLLRPCASRTQRRIWALFGAALTARALGFILYFTVVRKLDPIPYPSVSDAAWLTMYLLMMAGLIDLARATFSHLSTSLALDGLIAALAAAGIAVAFLYRTLTRLAAPGATRSAVATNLAYPALDMMLLLVVLGVLLAFGWKPPAAVWALGIGVAGFAIIDDIFLYQVAAGTFRPGTPLAAGGMVATAVIAFAAWAPPDGHSRSDHESLPGLIMPGVFALACLATLVYATIRPAPYLSVILTSAGVAVAIARTGMTFRTVRSVAEHRRDARTDELTGIANRRAFNETFAAILSNRGPARKLALLIVDLDNFKAVNDTLGHHHGDQLLVLVAARLQQTLRSGDLLARIGGDEFAAVLENADATLAIQVAGRLRAALRGPFPVGPRDMEAAASIGIALFPDDGLEPVELLQRADLAMYDAKSTQAGHSLFRPEHQVSSRRRRESVARLREAIESDELVLYYQPQVCLRTGAVTGVEALVRWQHPDVGLIPPADFLPQAESGGLMRQLTANVLDQAVRQCAQWHAHGINVTVAVNLSVTNLLDLEFPEHVALLLETAGLEGAALELELTEDLFMADPVRARKVIVPLLEAGVRMVVDDYGTGYSSLGYLRDLQEIRGLKLDRSFVTHLDVQSRTQAIVESTIILAKSLGLKLTAEGVETEPVRDLLAALGCEHAQGFLFSRPVPADSLTFGSAAECAPLLRKLY